MSDSSTENVPCQYGYLLCIITIRHIIMHSLKYIFKLYLCYSVLPNNCDKYNLHNYNYKGTCNRIHILQHRQNSTSTFESESYKNVATLLLDYFGTTEWFKEGTFWCIYSLGGSPRGNICDRCTVLFRDYQAAWAMLRMDSLLRGTK